MGAILLIQQRDVFYKDKNIQHRAWFLLKNPNIQVKRHGLKSALHPDVF